MEIEIAVKNLQTMKDYLLTTVPSFNSDYQRIKKLVQSRRSGAKSPIKDYIEGMILAMLTNSVPWKNISPHINSGAIPRIFHYYDPVKLKSANPATLVANLRAIKCGNRRDKQQMNSLRDNIEIIEKIIHNHGSFEDYLKSKSSAYPVIPYSALEDFQPGKRYKLQEMGIPLVCEFLKNMGFELPKPDVHLRRFLSADRMGTGHSPMATEKEVFDQIQALSKASGEFIPHIDLIIWEYCATGYGQICGGRPQCAECSFHNKSNKSCNHP